jgi:dihydrofolate reductase
MKLVIIAAMEKHSRVIGRRNDIPWNLPKDLSRFKKLTMGKDIVMGRKTFESIGRPLPGRRNMVVTSSMEPMDGIEIFPSLPAAVASSEELYVCGGASLYAEALTMADTMELTFVDIPGFVVLDGDVLFPAFDGSKWKVASELHVPVGCWNVHPMRWVTYQRI